MMDQVAIQVVLVIASSSGYPEVGWWHAVPGDGITPRIDTRHAPTKYILVTPAGGDSAFGARYITTF
jgi:hypothetical protein